jgi:hypothetical protein
MNENKEFENLDIIDCQLSRCFQRAQKVVFRFISVERQVVFVVFAALKSNRIEDFF